MPRPQAAWGRAAERAGLPVVTPEIAAEAAVWVARLHGPDRSVRMAELHGLIVREHSDRLELGLK